MFRQVRVYFLACGDSNTRVSEYFLPLVTEAVQMLPVSQSHGRTTKLLRRLPETQGACSCYYWRDNVLTD